MVLGELWTILRRSGPSIDALRDAAFFKQLLLTSSSVAKQQTKLEGKKLIVRTWSSTKRGRVVQLTDAGRLIADQVMEIGDDVFLSLFTALRELTAAEQAQDLGFIFRSLGSAEALRTRNI